MKRFFESICVGAALCALSAQAGELLKDDFSNSSAPWSYNSWKGGNQKAGGVQDDSSASAGKSLFVAAVKDGYAGWVSPLAQAPGEPAELTLKFRMKASDGYDGNTPRIFLTWFKGQKFTAAFFWSVPKELLEKAKSDWTDVELKMPAAKFPQDVDGVRANLASGTDQQSPDAKGAILFDKVSLETP